LPSAEHGLVSDVTTVWSQGHLQWALQVRRATDTFHDGVAVGLMGADVKLMSEVCLLQS
jgi:hypothetical protein